MGKGREGKGRERRGGGEEGRTLASVSMWIESWAKLGVGRVRIHTVTADFGILERLSAVLRLL